MRGLMPPHWGGHEVKMSWILCILNPTEAQGTLTVLQVQGRSDIGTCRGIGAWECSNGEVSSTASLGSSAHKAQGDHCQSPSPSVLCRNPK